MSNVYLIPPRKRDDAGPVVFEQKAFKQWVDDLPVGNVGLTARAIYDKLYALNRMDLSPMERFRALEMMLEPLQFVLQSLSKDIVWGPFPLSKRSTLVAELINKLHVLMIQGYKIVLDQLHNDSLAGKVLRKSIRAEALHRVFYFLGKDHLGAYQIYQNPKPHAWRELHGLYHYAIESKLQNKLLENEEPGEIKKSTVTDLYKQILLLSCAGPYQLQPGEIGKVHQALLRWVSKARLISLTRARPDDGIFLIDATADHPPRTRSVLGGETIRIGWVLDASGLASKLNDERQALLAKKQVGEQKALNNPKSMNADLLDKLMSHWGVESQRADERLVMGGQVTVACGMGSLYSLLGGSEIPEMAAPNYEAIEGLGERAVSHEPVSRARLAADEYLVESGDELKQFMQQQVAGRVPDYRAQAMDRQTGVQSQIIDESDDDAKGVCLQRCNVQDRSVNGYRLSWRGDNDIRAHIGELVGVRRDDGNGDFQVGVIRWFKLHEKSAVEFGIELFPGKMSPVIIRRKVVEGGIENWRGFLHRAQQYETLFVPLFYTSAEDQLYMGTQFGDEPISLGRSLEGSASFVRFEFTRDEVEERELEQRGAHAEMAGQYEEDMDFDGIWSEIQ
ncbi:MAG: hypothetical protein MI754_18775 [Chromatiales bacterium]|nr:hypothetical protein [Chromatiales bacterium]